MAWPGNFAAIALAHARRFASVACLRSSTTKRSRAVTRSISVRGTLPVSTPVQLVFEREHVGPQSLGTEVVGRLDRHAHDLHPLLHASFRSFAPWSTIVIVPRLIDSPACTAIAHAARAVS